MSCAQAKDDPYYQEPPAQWLRHRVEDTLDIELNIDENLTVAAAVNLRLRAIWVRPGLPFDEFHWLVCRATLYIECGAKHAPEFSAPIDQIRAVAYAMIIPFQRALQPLTAKARKH